MAVPPIQASIPTTAEPIVSSRASSSLDDKIASLPSSSRSLPSEEDLSLKANPFADPRAAAQWKQVYDDCEYECRYAFDPTLEWTEEEEKRIIRKLDWRVCLWACVMFFALQVDRGNLTQVVSDNFLEDLGMNTNDYNIGNTIFLVSFLFAELPSQLVSKKLGPDRWVPAQICLWSIVAALQCLISGRGSFFATRALLGILEGGFIPDIVLWLSYFYTSKELPIRLSYFWTTLSVTGVVTSLLAFALLRLRGVLGWGGWRWLFLIEGIITFTIGVVSFFMMPASAVQTKTWFRPNGWFSDREVAIVVNRVLRDDPSKGDMNNRQAITPQILWSCLTDYDLWPLYLLGLVIYIPQAPPSRYITLILRGIGFDTFTTNLLTIPSSVLHIITLLLITRLSEYLNEKTLVSSLQNIWIVPTLAALRWWPGTVTDAWGTYTLITVLLGYPYCHAILVAWTSRNSNSVGTRSVSAAVYNMSVQAGNVIANFIYLDDDKPLYKRGNSVLFAINIFGIAIFLATKAYYVWRNKQKEKVWNAMTEDERAYYISTTMQTGSRRLDFRFAH
ncbi:MFS general substrate transporter [Xylaria bambusicola]|uniref:MFS general substrate transporter n=1 Tax=Xylaria bambusicola TaxID=326684 RepID=UPI00200782C7|nr:MFS general substrate transporter [Xylaria bambusicola]KAI0516956.1 MFS general substrate transporter [Xylaria bambusicola]